MTSEVDRKELAALLARLEAATGADRGIDIAIWRMIDGGQNVAEDRVPLPWLHCYTSSIDAAVALVERIGLNWHKGSDGRAGVIDPRRGASYTLKFATVPLSIIGGAVHTLRDRARLDATPSPE